MPPILIRINGVDAPASKVKYPDLTIHDVLGSQPNTANLTFLAAAPAIGESVLIGLGSFTPGNLLFAGNVQVFQQTYQSRQGIQLWPADLIDYVWFLNRMRPFASFINVSATVIAQQLMTSYAPGFTAGHVQPNLPAISINFDGSQTLMSCLNDVATAIDGSCKIDYSRDLHLYLPPEPGIPPPDPIDWQHPPLNNPPIRFHVDLSQVRTRVYGKGHGTTTLSDVQANESILPVDSVDLFTASGGKAIAGLTSDAGQTIKLTYTGITAPAGGTLVGPGAAPVSAPSPALAGGTGINLGQHGYAYSWVTAAGETKPSPVGNVIHGPLPAPTATSCPSMGWTPSGGGSVPGGTKVEYTTVFAKTFGATNYVSPPNAVTIYLTTNFTSPSSFTIDTYIQTDAVGYYVWLARRDNGGPWYVHSIVPELPGLVTPGDVGRYVRYVDTSGPATAFGNLLTSYASNLQQTTLAGIATGPATVTSRKLYRTAANQAQLKFLGNLPDNTTTTVTDAAADASLGANAPTSDTSGLTQPQGQVTAGSTSLPTASAAGFSTSGGWVKAGQSVLRYTGISGNSLVGIPPNPPGNIDTTLTYGTQAVPSPALLGVSGNSQPILRGAKVHIFVQRDDTAAQSALATLERNPDGSATSGIREYMLTDERRAEASLVAACDAELARFSRPLVGVSYSCRDPKTRAGLMAMIGLQEEGTSGAFSPTAFSTTAFNTGYGKIWGYSGEFLIQDVTITVDPAPQLLPRYTVNATSAKFTFMDLLQRLLMD
jgi:hypothetical protein